jgi:hypothetical protein
MNVKAITPRVLPDLAALEAKLAALEAENAKLKEARKPGALSFKVTEKGAVSVYGLQRFPVTLYASQWARVIEAISALSAFIETNKASLATKD